VGGGAVCVIRSTGAVSCWGGTAPAATARFKQLSLGQYYGAGGACGVTAAGTIQCWTLQDPVISPPPAPPSGSSYLVASRGNALCGIDTAGRATCAGGTPEDHPSTSRTYRQIAVGFGHTCALAEDGSVTCTGLGTSAVPTCGDASVYECGQAAPIAGPFVQLALGAVHSCGLRANGTIGCWGAGRGTLNSTPFEQRQGVAPAVAFRYISASGHRTCGIRALDNGIECWGEPYDVPPPGGEYDLVSAGESFACALAKTGNIRCWGNLAGANGSTVPSSITGPFPLVPPG
jgi:alpha-tubulin suppressor-like RCC1 family protein